MSKPQRDQISAVSTLIEGRNTSFFGGSNFVFSIFETIWCFPLSTYELDLTKFQHIYTHLASLKCQHLTNMISLAFFNPKIDSAASGF